MLPISEESKQTENPQRDPARSDGGARGVIVLAVRGTVLFPTPETLTPLLVSREKSLAAIEAAMISDRQILVVSQREIEIEDVGGEDLFSVGTLASINRLLRLPDGTTSVLVEGLERKQIAEFTQTTPYLIATARAVPNPVTVDPGTSCASRLRSFWTFLPRPLRSPTNWKKIATCGP